MASFQDILNKPASQIERPKPYPVGTYLFLVEGQPNIKENVGKNKNTVVEYTLRFLQPAEDVDQQALMEMGGVQGKTLKLGFWVTDDAVYRLKEFLVDHLGIPESGSLREMLPQAAGQQVYGVIRHRTSEDGQQVYSEIASTAKV